MKYFSLSVLLCAFVLLNLTIKAQVFYKDGRIVTNNNDTIYGFIKDAGDIKNSKYCKFKADRNSKAKKFSPLDIKSYQLHNGKYYMSVNVDVKNNSEQRFTDVLLEGNYNLYFYRKNKEQLFYLETPEGKIIGLSNEKINIAKNTNTSFNSRPVYAASTFYMDSLYEEFKDWKPADYKLPKVAYNKSDLMDITKEYVQATCELENCISYERDLNINKANAGLFFGTYLTKINVVYYNIESNTIPSFMLGAFYSMPMNLISNNLDFHIELLWRNLDGNILFDDVSDEMVDLDVQSNTLGLPLLLKYNLSFNKINTALGIGYEYGVVFGSKISYKGQILQPNGKYEFGNIEKTTHKFQRGAWLADLSVSYKLNNKLSLYTGLRYQLLENLILEEEFDNRLTFNSAMRNTDALKYKSTIIGLRLGVLF